MTSYQDHIIELPKDVFEEIKEKVHRVNCPIDQAYVYEGQTPIVCYILLSGLARLSKKKSHIDICRPLTLIGVRQFLEQTGFPYTLNIEQGSEVGYIDRSTLFSILEDKNNSFAHYLDQSLAR